MSSRSRFAESSLKTNLSTVNEAALCEYSNLLALGYLATSAGKGDLDGWRSLSANNPSTAIPAAITLDFSTSPYQHGMQLLDLTLHSSC